jgi:hypothetical protein
MRPEFNELILTAEKNKKKGGSLGAVFKLIQDLTDFEEKIQECVDAQEIAENKQKIEEFLADIDKMYATLLDIAKGGIQSLRKQRLLPTEEEAPEIIEEEVEEAPVDIVEEVEVSKSPIDITVPKAPKI